MGLSGCASQTQPVSPQIGQAANMCRYRVICELSSIIEKRTSGRTIPGVAPAFAPRGDTAADGDGTCRPQADARAQVARLVWIVARSACQTLGAWRPAERKAG
jgi:hypothetical protein